MRLANKKSVVIVGGGLAGLTCSLILTRAGFEVMLVEKKVYPFHRVCGEYISNEVLPFFESIGIDVSQFNASRISKLAISSPSGNVFKTHLDLGGFGLSRFTLDNYLYEKAKLEGVSFILGEKANQILFADDQFQIALSNATTLQSNFVIAAYGKRSNLDKERKFFNRRSPYLGVKYHVKTDFPTNLVQLDNFEGGYCGTVKIENDRFNLCYLSKNNHLKKYGSIEEMEREVLFKNPLLKERFLNSDFLNEKPEVINEISFDKKPLVENHLLYCGDSAGMISPLCGNGMAMAIHSAKVLSECIINFSNNREALEKNYISRWNELFEKRLRTGRLTQKLFGRESVSEIAVKSLIMMPKLSKSIIKRTHGEPF